MLTEEEVAELEAIDALLKEESPEIFDEFEQIKAESLEGVISDFEVEEKRSRLIKFKELLLLHSLRIKATLKLRLLGLYYLVKKNVKSGASEAKVQILRFAKHLRFAFKAVPLQQKLKIIASALVIVSIPFGIWIGVTRFLDIAPPGTVTDLSLFAESTTALNLDSPSEDFLRSSRSPPNIFLVKRFIVNILGKGESGSPMLASEVYLESLNPHALAEIKSRESYFRDAIITFSSQWSYEELATREGKERYLNALKDELQNKIKRGQLSRVYFKSIILKP